MTRDAALLALIAILPYHEAPTGTELGLVRVHAIEAAFENGLLITKSSRDAATRELVALLFPVAFPAHRTEVS